MLLIIFTLYIRSMFKYMTSTHPQQPDKPAAMVESLGPAPPVSWEASCSHRSVSRCRECVLLAIPSCVLCKWKQIMRITEKSISPNKLSLDPIPSFAYVCYALIHNDIKLQTIQGTHR